MNYTWRQLVFIDIMNMSKHCFLDGLFLMKIITLELHWMIEIRSQNIVLRMNILNKLIIEAHVYGWIFV